MRGVTCPSLNPPGEGERLPSPCGERAGDEGVTNGMKMSKEKSPLLETKSFVKGARLSQPVRKVQSLPQAEVIKGRSYDPPYL